ncbi:hypothetical protein [Streptomyces sp. HPF1205]|uniref:hypothetical protein n=1 Tax=Streptomyces sp. HPF1205 TaxID=2873262 RepID=UPI001CED592D|nr:hypothetical protein [Streptomyces sp. HPF1205]
MSNLSILQSLEHPRRVLVIGSVRRTANGRTITATVTEAGGRGRITPARSAR